MLTVLRQRNFSLLWCGQVVSNIGDWVLWIALPFFVYEQTGSALATGTMFIVENLPRVFLSSFAGVFADRWDRRRTLIAADLARCVAVLLLLVIRSPEWLWLVYPLAFVESAVSQFFIPAKNALIPLLVEEPRLMAANTLNSIGDDLTMLIGPAIGGALLGFAGLTSVVLIDAASYLFSGTMVFLISVSPAARIGSHAVGTTGAAVWREWIAGLRLVKGEGWIAALFTVMGVAMLGQGIIAVLWVAFVREVLRGSALEYGWVQVAVAAGGILGGLLMERVSRVISPGRLVAWSGVAIGVLLLATFNFAVLPAILVFQILVGMAAVGFFVPIRTLLQTHTANEYLGRIFGAYSATSALLLLGGQALASVLGDHVGIVPMLNASGILYGLGGVVALMVQLPASQRKDDSA